MTPKPLSTSTSSPSRGLNVALWVLQVLLAPFFHGLEQRTPNSPVVSFITSPPLDSRTACKIIVSSIALIFFSVPMYHRLPSNSLRCR